MSSLSCFVPVFVRSSRWASFGITLALAAMLAAGDADAELADGKYGAAQVFDVQRSPAFPIANQNFRVSNFQRPYRATSPGGQYTIGAGQYIQFFKVSQTPPNCTYGINLYNADGTLVTTIAASGSVYGLGSEGFLHVSTPGGYGTFVANSAGYTMGQGTSLTYVPTTGLATCEDLEQFQPSTTPTNQPGPVGPPPAPVLSGVSVSNIGAASASLHGTSSANGVGYWIVVPQGSTAPTAAQVKAGASYAAVSVAAAGSASMSAAVAHTFTLTGLSSQTAYAAYLVAEDATPTFSTVGGPIDFSTPDVTPPATISGPLVTNLGYTSATIGVTLDEAATGYWQLLPDGDPAPDAAALVASGTSLAMQANVAASIALSSLSPASSYRIHFVARDAAGNIQTSVAGLGFTTPTPPATSANGAAPGSQTTAWATATRPRGSSPTPAGRRLQWRRDRCRRCPGGRSSCCPG